MLLRVCDEMSVVVIDYWDKVNKHHVEWPPIFHLWMSKKTVHTKRNESMQVRPHFCYPKSNIEVDSFLDSPILRYYAFSREIKVL